MSAADASVSDMFSIEPYGAPFLRPASLSPFDVIGDGVVDALCEHGANDLSISSVAKALRMTPQGLHQRLRRQRHEETETPVAVLCRMASVALSDRWLAWVRESLTVLGSELPVVRLPETVHECQGVAAWDAWHQISRGRALVGDPKPSEILAATHDEERELLGEALRRAARRAIPDHGLVVLLALGHGLRAQLVRPEPTLMLGVAQEVMARQVAMVLREETRPAA